MQQPPNNWQQPNTQYPPPQQSYQQPWQQPPVIPPPMPRQKPPKQKSNPWLIVGIIAAVLVIGAAIVSNGTKSSSPSAQATPTIVTQATSVPTDTPAPTDTPTPTPKPLKWTVTHTFSGNGDKKTEVFSVPDDWKILWSCTDNTGYNVGGVLYVEVYNSDNTDFDLSAVSATCAPGKTTRDSTEEHQSGNVYLNIIDGLPWTVQVQELK